MHARGSRRQSLQLALHTCGWTMRRTRTLLTAAQVRGTMQILAPEARVLSPAVGLLYLNSSVFSANLYHCNIVEGHGWGLGQACALSKDIFFQQHPGGPVRATRSRSKAASHLSVSLLGQIVGLALSDVSDKKIASTLRAFGIESNKIDGEWTGVSFVRYTRLVDTIRSAWLENPATPALMMILQVVSANSMREMIAVASVLLFYLQRSLRCGKNLTTKAACWISCSLWTPTIP